MPKPTQDELIEQMKANAGLPRGQPSPTGAYPTTQRGGGTATENLQRALQLSENSQQVGYSTLQTLGKQRETIQHSLDTAQHTREHYDASAEVIRSLRWNVWKEWIIKGCVILSLVGLVVLITYAKFIR